jgi:hypothetical protein
MPDPSWVRPTPPDGSHPAPYLRRVLLIFLIAMPIMLLSMYLLIPTLVRTLAPMASDSLGRFIANWTIWLIVSLPALLVTARLSLALPGSRSDTL